MNIASLITSFATASSYTVTRTARSTVVRGRKVAGTQSTFTITAAVVPVSGLNLSRMPEGHTDLETHNVYTTTELTAGGQGADYEADKITIDGDSWEVDKVERWVDPHTRAVGYKVSVTRE